MKRPAVFFDRDNTLIVNDGHLGNPDAVTLVVGASDSVARVRSLGYATLTFSNQSGVARGLYTEQDVHRVNARVDELLRDGNENAIIDRHDFCPYHPDAVVARYRQASEFRKPAPGMLYQASRALDLDLAKSWVVGDAPRDIEAGQAAGCRTVLIKDPSLKPSEAAAELSQASPEFMVSNLSEAVGVIEREGALRGNVGETGSGDLQTIVPSSTEAATVETDLFSVQPSADVGPAPEPEHHGNTDVVALVPNTVEVPMGDSHVKSGDLPAPDVDAVPETAHHGQENTDAVEEPVQNAYEEPIDSPEKSREPPSVAAFDQTPSSVASENQSQESQTVDSVESANPTEPELTQANEDGPTEVPGEDATDTAEEQPADAPAPALEKSVPRRSIPAVILAAKAAREAAKQSLPNASPEVLRLAARQAAREVAAGGAPTPFTETITEEPAGDAPPMSGGTFGEFDPDRLDDSSRDSKAGVMDETASASIVVPSITSDEPMPETPFQSEPTEMSAQAEIRSVPSAVEEPVPETPPAAEVPATSEADVSQTPRPAGVSTTRMEELAEQILQELRNRNEPSSDFSVSKLMAGITMFLSLGVLVYGYMYKDNAGTLQSFLLLSILLQVLTVSLTIMGRQK